MDLGGKDFRLQFSEIEGGCLILEKGELKDVQRKLRRELGVVVTSNNELKVFCVMRIVTCFLVKVEIRTNLEEFCLRVGIWCE